MEQPQQRLYENLLSRRLGGESGKIKVGGGGEEWKRGKKEDSEMILSPPLNILLYVLSFFRGNRERRRGGIKEGDERR